MRGTIFYVPVEQAITPADGHCYTKRWWAVHPEKGVVFHASSLRHNEEPNPQCHDTEWIARKLQTKLYPDCETKYFPAIYEAHAIKELNRVRAQARKGPSK